MADATVLASRVVLPEPPGPRGARRRELDKPFEIIQLDQACELSSEPVRWIFGADPPYPGSVRRIALVAGLLAHAACDEVVGLKQRPDAAPAPIDAPPDAPPDALACPEGYASIEGLTSRYRIITTPGTGKQQHLACLADGTHLMVPASVGELALVHEALASAQLTDDRAWIGVVQGAGANTPAEGWIAVTDELPNLEWAMTAEGEPNDGADNMETGEEQLVHLQRGAFRYLIDGNALMMAAAICECDGRPMTTAGLAAMAPLP